MATKKEDLNQFFDGIFPHNKCLNCKNDTFQMCYMPTPSTPPDILSVVTNVHRVVILCKFMRKVRVQHLLGKINGNIKGNLNNGN
jgi:hypothetical protein